ncbi:unnamed protein product [Bursaphelenchus xylophilus]|uniref:(pine wood nematode) hypothetical protein n=1 Tax=Bursaphelenchus xylophilus TaxID=6326 RepID=A0A1I7SBW7_BURXY|nr:unnamed protein product [Bursaphelenchus xylophilus]CAG9089160.1 unnamed protein product [Bursaphelenchus xylophilus]
MDPSQYIDALISIEVKDGDVFQGRVAEIRPGDNPSVVLRGAFKDGIPVPEHTTEVKALEIKNLKIVEEAQKSNKSPQKPHSKPTQKPKKAEKTSVAALIENKCESPKNAKITLLKRGGQQNDYGLSAEMSSSCVVSETVKVKPEKKPAIPVEMIPAAVLNGRKSDKSVLNKLFVKSDKKPKEEAKSEKEDGKHIIDKLLNTSENKRKTEEKQAFKKFGDFKQFTEKQQPDFNKFASDRPSNRKQKGPSGNPAKDQENGYKSRGRNKDLAESLNLEDLNEDFDFSSNLALFDKDRPESHSEDYEEPDAERPASRRNYRHDENIINDPNRCTSWVQSKQKPTLRVQPETLPHKVCPETKFTYQFHAKHTTVCENGAILPVLRRSDKDGYLNAALTLFNNILYNLTLADRFSEYALDVFARNDVHPRHVVVVAGEEANIILTHRVCQHLLNRRIPVILYRPPEVPGDLLSRVTVVRDIEALPTSPHVIFVINPQVFHESEHFRRWIMKTGKLQNHQKRERNTSKDAARVISLDFRIYDLQYMHTMMVGAADESIFNTHRKRNPSNQNTTFECCVADLGTPYEWIVAAGANPHDAFKKSYFVRLQNVA